MAMTIKEFQKSIIDSFPKTDPSNWVEKTLDEVMKFHGLRQRKTEDPATAQAKSFSAIRKGIYTHLPKIETGDSEIDRQGDRWTQTKILTMAHPKYDELVTKVDPIYKFKYNKASKIHNQNLRKTVTEKQNEAVSKFSIETCMNTAYGIIKSGLGPHVDKLDLFVVLLLVTGRRQQELYNQMHFEPAGPYHLKVSSFAKSLDKNGSAIIPSLFDSGIIVQRINEVRRAFADPDRPVNSLNRKISERCKTLFPDASTTHQLRALYAQTCERIFNNTTFNDMQIKSTVFKKNALHHGSIKMTNQHYEIVASDLQSDQEVKEYIKKFKKMNASLKKKQPLEVEFILPEHPTGLYKRVLTNIKIMTKDNEPVNYENYKARFGGTEETFDTFVDANKSALEDYHDYISN